MRVFLAPCVGLALGACTSPPGGPIAITPQVQPTFGNCPATGCVDAQLDAVGDGNSANADAAHVTAVDGSAAVHDSVLPDGKSNPDGLHAKDVWTSDAGVDGSAQADGQVGVQDATLVDGVSLKDGVGDAGQGDGDGVKDVVPPVDGGAKKDISTTKDVGGAKDAGAAKDSGAKKDTGPPPCKVPCAAGCCKGAQICLIGQCVVPKGPCIDGDDCSADHKCVDKKCIPFGPLPAGKIDWACVKTVPLGVFAPSIQCAWDGPPAGDKLPNHRNVLGTPVVTPQETLVSLMDPVIAFVSYDKLDGGAQSAACSGGAFGAVRIIRGKDCKQLHTLSDVKVRASAPIAAGDLDGDGQVEFVGVTCPGGLVAWARDPNTDTYKSKWVSKAFYGSTLMWAGPSLHDLDNDGFVESLLGGWVFDKDGKVVDSSAGTLHYQIGIFPVVADVDMDFIPELLTGDLVFEFKGGKWVKQASTGQLRGHTAIADFGTYGADPKKDDRSKLDGIADVAVISGGKLRVQNIAGRVVFGPVALPGGGSGGTPTAGDFDNDGRVEVAVAGKGSYTLFDPDCNAKPGPKTCQAGTKNGILWSQPSQDHSSSSTGSSVFDFEGDGKAEAIYADECFARVYDGSTGEVIYSQYHTSCTWYENPVVADVDGDFKSELVVPSNLNCNMYSSCTSKLPKLPGTSMAMDPLFKGLRCVKAADCPGGSCSAGICRCTKNADCGPANASYRCGPPIAGTPGQGKVCRSVMLGAVGGVRVYQDIQDRWVNSRPIWNQHAYAITHVGDAGDVPFTGAWQANWLAKGLNSFRQNAQGSLDPSAVPDLTAKPPKGVTCAGGNMLVQASVCNRGTKPVGAGLGVAVYVGPPKAGAKAACTAKTAVALKEGQCTPIKCPLTPAPKGKVDLHVVADDGGQGKGENVECHEKNNHAILSGASCP